MAVHIIPKKTKVKMEIFRGVTLFDVFYALFCLGVFILFLQSNFPFKVYIGLGVTAILVIFMFRNNGVRIYANVGWLFRFFSFKKHYYSKTRRGKEGNMKMLAPYTGIITSESEGDFIDFKEYYAKVVEIFPINLGLLQEEKQNMMINAFANALRRINQNQFAQLVKLNKPLVLDWLNKVEDQKEDNIIENAKLGLFSNEELLARDKVFVSRKNRIDYFNNQNKIYKDRFYLVVYGRDKHGLFNTVWGIKQSLSATSTPLGCKELKGSELCVFLKANYGREFDEREIESLKPEEYIDWIMPKDIKFSPLQANIDGHKFSYFTVTDYPLSVYNAWGLALTQIENARVVVNFRPLPRIASERLIDRSIIEMETQALYAARLSERIDKDTALQTMKDLLVALKNENEQLFDCTIHICAESKDRREVKAALKENNFRFNEMFCRQIDAFISANISQKDNITEAVRGMQTTSLAAFFPFVSSDINDDAGVYVGYGAEGPAFVNFFLRNDERQNSNMIIIGKTGSGKSFAAKTLLANLAADDSKIFVLDPEFEYKSLAEHLGGKIVDVGNGSNARFNPFHVFENLEMDDDEKDAVKASTFETHLQFLEEFFRFILDGISPDALESLNTVVAELYKSKGITTKTNFSKLKPEDYPNFDDLYEITKNKLAKSKDSYESGNLKTVLNYITKFATGGRNAGLWNGPSSITSNENFVLFSFQSLLANRNKQIATAQMLLVFKYLNNEIIKNREFNEKYRPGIDDEGTRKRKLIVVVDEAHLFMNPKYPIALDFMFDMAKRIRKYYGMQIIITQNIRDFMGSDDMIRQSSAIIAASQYSLIFSLSPTDVTELVKLYKNAGEINATEQDRIATAGRGDCFLITGPMSRTQVHIQADADLRSLFDKDFAATNSNVSFIEEETEENAQENAGENYSKLLDESDEQESESSEQK